jgi:tetratricopeptide (TPR) repeat protein
MKINRQPVAEITPEMVARDHKFWSDYSERLIGNRITYDTPMKEICDFCEKVYVTHDYSGFTGDPKFLRDEDAQKSFSKLRNAIGASIYQWRADRAAAGPWTFSGAEIQDLPGVVERWRQHADPVSDFLWRGLSSPQQSLLRDYQTPASNSSQALEAIVQALNKVIGGTNLYEPGRFQSVSLRPAAVALLQQNPKGANLSQLNRLLLEDAYPHELSMSLNERMTREAEFALKQAFAYCPFSPEAVYHLMVMYINQHRLEDTRLMLATAQKLDPHNEQLNGWLANVESGMDREELMNLQSRFNQVQQLVQAGKNAEAEALLDSVAQDPHAGASALSMAAMGYAGVGKAGKGVALLEKLAAGNPKDWTLWFYLARLQAVDGKAAQAATALRRAFAINSADLLTNQNQQTVNLHDFVKQDQSFDKVRQTPEFQNAMGK